MKLNKKHKLSIFLITLIILQGADIYSCSTVLLKNKWSLLIGRNLDALVDLPGYLCINKRGEIKKPLILPIPNCHTAPWLVKYGSVTFTALGRGFSDGGMNEKGLVIEEMSLYTTQYLADTNHTYLTSPQWIQLQLDNFGTVEEVIANLSSILPIGWSWHFFVADRTGNSASIEFINGELVVHTGKEMAVPCMTNSTYSESVEHYKKDDGQNDQDNSLMRFSTAAKKIMDFERVNQNESIEYAFDLLSSITIDAKYAKRSIVYDVLNQAVYFRTDSNTNVRMLFFKDLDFKSDNKYLDLNASYEGNINTLLEISTLESESDLHVKIEKLLLTLFDQKDEFPNLGISVKLYLDKTHDYYVANSAQDMPEPQIFIGIPHEIRTDPVSTGLYVPWSNEPERSSRFRIHTFKK